MAFDFNVALGMLQRLARGEQNLVADQVNAGDFLGHGMLDLDALVDFQEIEIALVIHDEFDGAGIGVMGGFGDSDGGFAHFFAQFPEFVFEQGRGSFLDDFLVAALDGAIAFAQMDDAALMVAENLDFDVVRVFDEFLDVNAGIAEGFFRLGAGGVKAFHRGKCHCARRACRVRRRRRWL